MDLLEDGVNTLEVTFDPAVAVGGRYAACSGGARPAAQSDFIKEDDATGRRGGALMNSCGDLLRHRDDLARRSRGDAAPCSRGGLPRRSRAVVTRRCLDELVR